MLSTKIKTTKYKYGEISYLSDDMYIGKSLKLYGDYCEDEPELWRKIIDPGCVAIDVGANIGALSLPLARMVGPVGRVIAYEAQQQNYDLLCRNVEQNEITNIDTEHVALGGVSGVTHVPSYDELGHTNYGRVVTGTGSEEVARTTLDICLEDVADIKFIKIDVEGDELEVLRGARETIECHRPVLYVENDRPEKSGELLGFIRSLNYRIYDHLVPLYKENNWKNNKTNLFENLYAINVLCIPAEHTDKYRHLTDHMSAVVPASPKVGKTGWAGIARLVGSETT